MLIERNFAFSLPGDCKSKLPVIFDINQYVSNRWFCSVCPVTFIFLPSALHMGTIFAKCIELKVHAVSCELENMEGIDIHEYKVGALHDIALLKASGFIDTNTSPELQKVINQTIENGHYQIIVDMATVQYVSSAGWGVFVGEIRRLKEKGGDLKLSQMSPDVNEVFEMLEFNRILSCYERLEEAIDDFDFYRDLNALSANDKAFDLAVQYNGNGNGHHPSPKIAAVPSIEPVVIKNLHHAAPRSFSASEVDEKRLPVHEKIKKIVLDNPLLGIWGIQKMLFGPRFGYTKVGLFELRALLKKLNLNTKAKRCRYYRSR